MGNRAAFVVAFLIRFIYGGMQIVTKDAFNEGMSTSVFVFYRHAIAILFLVPVAFVLERYGSFFTYLPGCHHGSMHWGFFAQENCSTTVIQSLSETICACIIRVSQSVIYMLCLLSFSIWLVLTWNILAIKPNHCLQKSSTSFRNLRIKLDGFNNLHLEVLIQPFYVWSSFACIPLHFCAKFFSFAVQSFHSFVHFSFFLG